jgi:hypothetical protein
MPTLDEIRTAGLAALRERLGLVGMVRFLQMFSNGSGDYVKSRRKWVERTTLAEIRKLAANLPPRQAHNKRSRN